MLMTLNITITVQITNITLTANLSMRYKLDSEPVVPFVYIMTLLPNSCYISFGDPFFATKKLNSFFFDLELYSSIFEKDSLR